MIVKSCANCIDQMTDDAKNPCRNCDNYSSWQPNYANKSDGSTASYYELPEGATQLQDLISYRNMDAQVGEAFRSLYRFGMASHSDKIRDAKKVIFYMQAEIEMLEKYGDRQSQG